MVRASKKRKLQQEAEDGASANRVEEPRAKKAKGESATPSKKKNKFIIEGATEKPTEKKSKSRNAGHSQGKKTQKVKSSVSKGGINGVQSEKSAKFQNGAKKGHKKNSA
jgi:hypothetical protein